MTKEVLKLALEALENNRQTHHYCEDTWYSCPKHEDGCANDSEGDECNCGADKANAEIDKAITAIKEALMSVPDGAQPEQEPVTLSEGKKLILVDGSFDDLMYWLERCESKGHLENCSDLIEPWEKFCDSYCVWTDHHPDCKLAEQEPVAWVPYLSDRADGVSGHYAIARRNPRGYREVWNLRRHAWGAYSDDVLSLEEADTLLRLIEIPTRKVETPQPAQQEPVAWAENDGEGNVLWDRESCFSDDPEWLDNPMPLYTTPPQRKPLTDEEIRKVNHHMVEGAYDYSFKQGVKWAEYKHGIKEIPK